MQSSNFNLINHPNHSDSDLLLPLGKRRLCLKRMNESSIIHNQTLPHTKSSTNKQNLPKKLYFHLGKHLFQQESFYRQTVCSKKMRVHFSKRPTLLLNIQTTELGCFEFDWNATSHYFRAEKKPYWGRGEKTCCECTMYNCTSYPANLILFCVHLFLFVCLLFSPVVYIRWKGDQSGQSNSDLCASVSH